MSTDNQQLTELEVKNTETSLYLVSRAEIDTQIATAKAFPRSLTGFVKKAMTMATMTEGIAASCGYALPRQGKTIEGKSVRLAEIALVSYGNAHAGTRIVGNDGKKVTAQGVCWDLESNVRITREVERRITDKNGKTYNEDMQILTGNAASSIALRNAIFAVIPSALTDEIYEEAKKVARGTAATLVTRRDKAIEYFKGIGVTGKQLCAVLEIKKIEDIDLDKLALLTGMRTAIRNGETTVKDLFEVTPEQKKEDMKNGNDKINMA